MGAFQTRSVIWHADAPCWGTTLDEALASVAQADKRLWLHVVTDDHERAHEVLGARLGLNQKAIAHALDANDRPYVEQTDEELYLSALEVRRENGLERFVELGLFVRRHALVTLCAEASVTVDAVWKRFCEPPTPGPGMPIELVVEILDTLADDYFPHLDALEDQVDAASDAIFEFGKPDLAALLGLKRRLLLFRRAIGPLRDILNVLLRRGATHVSPNSRDDLQDVYDHTLRLLEIVDLNRDVVTSMLDAHLSIESNRLNQVMRLLTVISTVLMSMAFIAGVYGMNFVHMPEIAWPLGYPMAICLMALVATVEVWLFRRRGWL